MGTKYNRYYNDPNLGAAFSNLASIFAPPDPTDELAYAQAAKARLETQGLGDLYGLASDPNADAAALDRLGAATGQWSPSSGFGARNMASADRRYGVDVGAGVTMRGQDITSGDNRYNTDSVANTSRLNNANTVRGSVISNLFGPLNPGQVRPEVPDELMGAIGLSGVGSVAGMPETLSTDEVEAQQLLAAIGGGQYGPADAAASAKSDINVEQIVGENGPVFATRGDAVGQQPYINPGSAPAQQIKTYTTPGGRSGMAVFNPSTGVVLDEATGERLPPGTVIGDVTDTKQGMTTAFETSDQLRANAVTSALGTIDTLTQLIQSNPASQGIAGRIRGTAQDLVQTGSEFGDLFGGTIEQTIKEARAAAANDPGLAAAIPQMYDPSIPAIEMLTNVLAWQYAKTFAGDRVSNEQLRTAREAIGNTLLGNQESSMARLGSLRASLSAEGSRLTKRIPGTLANELSPLLAGPQGAAPAPAPAAPRQRARNPQTGEMVEWDGQQWVPVQ